ncbi:MAG: hypothetical protein E6I79_05150, partial [Chloroflexi bacterium]
MRSQVFPSFAPVSCVAKSGRKSRFVLPTKICETGHRQTFYYPLYLSAQVNMSYKSKERVTIAMQTSFSNVVATAIAYLSEIDPVMRAAIERVGPCTLEPDSDIFNALVDAIISQQISVKAADAIMARVRAALPEGKVTPEALLPFDFERLRTLG